MVAGTDEMPPAAACFVVGGALAAAAALVGGVGGQRGLARLARTGVAVGLTCRGLTGVLGRTGLLVPWTPSLRFQDMDRRAYGPLCLALGVSIGMTIT